MSTILADKNLREKVLMAIIGDLMQECDHLCGKKNMVSILRKSKPDDLLQFSWEKLQSEWKKEAPTLYRILEAVATPRLAAELSEDRLPSVCVAGSILLRSRNQHVCYTTSHRVNPFPWKCKKTGNQVLLACDNWLFIALFIQTHNRLNHLQITVSPTATLSKMEEFGAKFDEKVLAWVKTLSETLEAQKDTNKGEVIAVL